MTSMCNNDLSLNCFRQEVEILLYQSLLTWSGALVTHTPILSTTTQLSQQETVSGSGISWAICKSASWTQTHNHASIPPLSFFTGRMPLVPPNQQSSALRVGRH